MKSVTAACSEIEINFGKSLRFIAVHCWQRYIRYFYTEVYEFILFAECRSAKTISLKLFYASRSVGPS